MSNVVIKAENVSKLYRLGNVNASTLKDDIKIFGARLMGKENPTYQLAQANERSTRRTSEYVWALRDIDFEVNKGDVLGVIGNNGAGKSTLLKVLSKVTSPTVGCIKLKGRVASLLEVGTGFHPELTGKENMYLNGHILGMSKKEINAKFDEIVDFAGIEKYLDTPVKRYSSGMYVRLAFAVAAHLEPEILIVDEVLAVGDVEFQKKAIGKMQEVSKGDGRTVLFVSHNLGSVQNLCNRGLLLNNGSVAFAGTATEAVNKYVAGAVNFNTAHYIEIDKSTKSNTESNEIEIKSVGFLEKFENNQYATNDQITIELNLFANKAVSDFRIAFGIYNVQEQGIASHFTQPKFSMNARETKKMQLKISHHQLAKGQYYFNFAVGKGNEITGVKEFDIVMKTLFFEIAFTDPGHNDRIALWDNSGWGHTNLQMVDSIMI